MSPSYKNQSSYDHQPTEHEKERAAEVKTKDTKDSPGEGRKVTVHMDILSSLPKKELGLIHNVLTGEVDDMFREGIEDPTVKRSEDFFQFMAKAGSTSLFEVMKAYGVVSEE